jgi:hypothetical protein
MSDGAFIVRLHPSGAPYEEWNAALTDADVAMNAVRDKAGVALSTPAHITGWITTEVLQQLGLMPGDVAPVARKVRSGEAGGSVP